jgi:hypothetical protein
MYKLRIRWPGNVTRMCEIINAYKILYIKANVCVCVCVCLYVQD